MSLIMQKHILTRAKSGLPFLSGRRFMSQSFAQMLTNVFNPLLIARRVATTTFTTYNTNADTAAVAQSADSAITVFSSRLLAAPHRDLTHVPYGDWFTLYVGTRKVWKATADAAVNITASSQGDIQQKLQQQQQTKLLIDALLWSSLFARHWSEVQEFILPSSSHYRWWWHPEASFNASAIPAQGVMVERRAASIELCTSDFLTEPLLGGRYLRLWMEDVRASTKSGASMTENNLRGSSIVLLPFSALWEIKQSAYWRPFSTSDRTSSAAAPAPAPAPVNVSPFSLQERQARQALLQTIDQLLQLQCDAGETSVPLQQICVLSPTQEWDLMCEAPRFIQALYPSNTSSTSLSPPRWLSIGSLCEDASARLAYCAHFLNWQQLQQRYPTSSQPETQATPLRVLSPSTEQARFRRYALTYLHEHSKAKAALDLRHASRQQPTLNAAMLPGSATSAATVHGQARKGCSDAVRRMSTREENIRQSFSVR